MFRYWRYFIAGQGLDKVAVAAEEAKEYGVVKGFSVKPLFVDIDTGGWFGIISRNTFEGTLRNYGFTPGMVGLIRSRIHYADFSATDT